MQTRGSDMAIYRRLFLQARPYWLHIAGIFLLSLLDGPLGLVTPLPLKIAVDSGIGSHPLPRILDRVLPPNITGSPSGILLLAAFLMVAFAALGGLLGLASTLLRSYTAEQLVLSFRTRVFAHLQRMSLKYHDAKGTADSVYRIQNDTVTLQYICLDGLPPFVTSVFTLAAMFYVTFRIDKELALVAMGVAPFLFVFSQRYRPLFRERSKEVKRLESSAMGVVQEVLSALRVVKAFGREQHEENRYVRQGTAGMWARIKLEFIGGAYSLVIGLVTTAGTAAVLWIGMRHVRTGELTLGSLLLVMSYLGQLYSPLKTIGRKAASLQGNLVGAERAFSVLDQERDVPERPNALSLKRASGSITFQNISFAYDEGHPVLHDICFEVPAGARVGISGRTGAGKTTLLSLLTRLYDPTSGAILLDGSDLRDYRLVDLRNQFAIVLQEPVLFSTTIAENIAYARPEAREEEIVRAAKLADAHDFIVGLANGYQTVVGERGMRLSGGERQRIALARAFLKDAPVLLLDEPTSSVDMKTEEAIMKATERLMQGRTTFLIAHRLSTLEHCDFRLEMEHGRLVSTVRTTLQNANPGPLHSKADSMTLPGSARHG
ncbi:MAG: ABC transporter ATP-binding protein [Acidobacteria bacterium]|nr:MAG: ABC transporter ATP-binding protein [Acidobacteriota bacterium]PYS16509.1 MAG: ABC transporter ATP-binding protein [Acidobacteriota bacterium]